MYIYIYIYINIGESRIASASEKVFARFFGDFLGVLVRLKSVFSDG